MSETEPQHGGLVRPVSEGFPGKLKPGLNLSNHDPGEVAAVLAPFDRLTRARLIVGIGPGGLASDWELFGNAESMQRDAACCRRSTGRR